jgi:hypothetical protein
MNATTPPLQAFRSGGVKLMEDAEDLVGVNGAQGQVVVGVAAVVEVESAEQAGVQQPRDDLLDILRSYSGGRYRPARAPAGRPVRARCDDMPQSAMSV